MSSAVTRPMPATSQRALQYFKELLEFETDCWDVHHAITNQRRDFILVDVRSVELYQKGHLPEAINIHHHQLKADRLNEYAPEQIFVVYCAGPHCNGADKAAIALANLDRPVKKMIGGVTGWLDEGFELIKSNE